MPTQSPADAFLLAFHARHAGATTRAFADGRIDGVGSTYDWLASTVPSSAGTVLDLGCGDGYLLERCASQCPEARLIGVDFSPEELALAKLRRLDGRAAFVHAHASALPLPSQSVDHAVSHFAFMLMSPLDEVLSELARVLRPGARLATVIGGGPKLGSSFEIFVDEVAALRMAKGITVPALVDRRLRSDRGLSELFAAQSEFDLVGVRDATVTLDGPFDAVWDRVLATVYELFAFGPDDLAELRRRFEERVQPRIDPAGGLPCAMAARLVIAARR